jgi:hypothetical protein
MDNLSKKPTYGAASAKRKGEVKVRDWKTCHPISGEGYRHRLR